MVSLTLDPFTTPPDAAPDPPVFTLPLPGDPDGGFTARTPGIDRMDHTPRPTRQKAGSLRETRDDG